MKQEIGKTVEYWKIYRQVLNLYIYLGIRRAILSVPLNTDLTWIQLKTRLIMFTEVYRGH